MEPRTFVLADESLNSYGFWLLMSGCDVKQFKKNPLMLWMHSRAFRGTKDEVLPIGRWDNIRIEDGKLLADAVFDESDEFAMKIADKVEGGFLKMASVGITVVTLSSDPKNLKPGQSRETVTKWRPREASIVDIGANDNAMCFYDEAGEILNLSQGEGEEIPVKLLQTTNTNQTNVKMERLAMLALVGLAAAATDEQLAEKIQELVNKNTQLAADKEAAEKKLNELSEKQAAERKLEATNLLDAAIKQGRLNAESKPSWEKMFDADHESAKITLATIPQRQSAKDLLSGNASDKNLGEREKLEKMSWDELDKSGKLAVVKEQFYDLFEEKFEVKFGSKPSKK